MIYKIKANFFIKIKKLVFGLKFKILTSYRKARNF